MTAIQANNWPYPRWIGHRGAGKIAPENTLAAFRTGASYGYRMFECDVKLSSDGVPFLLHDDLLDRTTSGRGVAGDCRWEVLSQLDAGSWHSRSFAGEPLPTFDAIVQFCLSNHYALNIELKPTEGGAQIERQTGEVVARRALQLWKLWGVAQPLPLLSSFKPQSLAGALIAAPSIPRGLLLDSLWEGWLVTAQELDCAAVIGDHLLWDSQTVGAVKALGMKCLSYTVNEAIHAERLWALGTDGIITDRVDLFAPSA